MGLINRIQAKLELFRLEQRYTNRKNRRTAFSSDAIYVDGEYVYASSNNTGSSSRSDQSMGSEASRSSTNFDSSITSAKAAKRRSMMVFPGEPVADIETRVEGGNEAQVGGPQRRWSRNWGKGKRDEDKRRSMAVVREARWEDGQ
ncbi:hypothetical protein V493_06046 [Pseudogymnoascus sp. VKM F-4281 (FW-2241)]|nr:hypothetical protein V493_06046 [Pseudogymnoascus sp. VKM F-4281 (FW-2241)]